MVNWSWLVVAFMLGVLLSFILIGLLTAAKIGDGDA